MANDKTNAWPPAEIAPAAAPTGPPTKNPMLEPTITAAETEFTWHELPPPIFSRSALEISCMRVVVVEM